MLLLSAYLHSCNTAPAEKIDIEVKNLDFILLEFTGKGVFGNWADVKAVVVDS